MEFFATCPSGFEPLLAEELQRLEIPRTRPLKGQVSFEGNLADAYKACLWSHLASRVVAVIARFDANDADKLYDGMHNIPWETHLASTSTFAVEASGTNDQIRNTRYSALRSKDAINDRLLERTGAKAAADVRNPDVSIVVRVSRNRGMAGIDLAGTPLFRRTYERASMAHDLRADYAAALLLLGDWQACTHLDCGPTLVDITPGGGTLLAEAALMAAHRAPGLGRIRWGFAGWLLHDHALWQRLVAEAQNAALAAIPQTLYVRSGGRGLSTIRSAVRSAGVQANVQTLPNVPDNTLNGCLLSCNLSALRDDDLAKESELLSLLAAHVAALQPTHAVVATRDRLPQRFLATNPQRELQGVLGRDPVLLCRFDEPAQGRSAPTVTLPSGEAAHVLVPASDQFVARLKKNARTRSKWAKREDVSCYRLYDADLPDYAVAIDLYQGTNPQTGMPDGKRWLVIAEYAPPKGVDPTLARSRLVDVLSLAPKMLGVEPRNTFLRVRRREKGGSQYADEAKAPKGKARRSEAAQVPLPAGAHLIDEGGLTFEANFSTRLDCGIFLDHRETRSMLREMAKQTKGSKRFLNLFCYTATATCYAADGGMRHTTSVDLSGPSLDWAHRNMLRNGFDGKEHEFVQADVLRWISEQRHSRNRWDLVFCDVPTFSNSKGMGRRSFDVQRDHAELIIGVSRLLTRDGVGIFSCNLRTFKPDVEALAKAKVTLEDITAQTIPEDFARNQRIHHAFIVRRTG